MRKKDHFDKGKSNDSERHSDMIERFAHRTSGSSKTRLFNKAPLEDLEFFGSTRANAGLTRSQPWDIEAGVWRLSVSIRPS